MAEERRAGGERAQFRRLDGKGGSLVLRGREDRASTRGIGGVVECVRSLHGFFRMWVHFTLREKLLTKLGRKFRHRQSFFDFFAGRRFFGIFRYRAIFRPGDGLGITNEIRMNGIKKGDGQWFSFSAIFIRYFCRPCFKIFVALSGNRDSFRHAFFGKDMMASVNPLQSPPLCLE